MRWPRATGRKVRKGKRIFNREALSTAHADARRTKLFPSPFLCVPLRPVAPGRYADTPLRPYGDSTSTF